MPHDLAMDMATGDLVLRDGDVLIIDNAERVAQQILITLRFWLGEWFLDTKDGIPYLEYVLVKSPNLLHIRQIFTEAMEKVDGVKRVEKINIVFEVKNRSLEVDYEVTTDYGLIKQREVLGDGRNEIRFELRGSEAKAAARYFEVAPCACVRQDRNTD